ncbi:bifunctional RNase H/acid phosphatase [Calidifontibacter terrae]
MTRSLIVEADGGSRGNPGVAGYGALVRDPATGEIIARRAAPLGKASNNVAEYEGLLAGLRAALAIDPAATIEVRMDSKLVIEQMAGRWKIKHEDMKRLAIQGQELVRQLRAAGGSISWTWIPREINKDADALSNDGMDGLFVEEDLEDAPVVQEAVDEVVSPVKSAAPQPVRILLVRHGVTDFTVQGRLDGRGGADPSLNAEGREQAAAAARGVRAKVRPGASVRVIASGLARAQQTADAIAAELGVNREVDVDLDEQNFGDWDGQSVRDLVADADFARLRSDPTYAPPGGGETHDLVAHRVGAALDRIVASSEPGNIVVVVSHRKPIMVALADVLGLDLDTAWLLAIAPASLTGLEVWSDGHTSISFVNDTNHLRTR